MVIAIKVRHSGRMEETPMIRPAPKKKNVDSSLWTPEERAEWLDRRYEREDEGFDNLVRMMLEIERWGEKYGRQFEDARRLAKTQKKLFDAADALVNQGYDPEQVSLTLQYHFNRSM
jgi:hypothetical protein